MDGSEGRATEREKDSRGIMKGLICLVVTLFVAGCHGCNVGYEDVAGKCLNFYVSASLTWDEGKAYCEANGGVLASIKTASELRAAFEYIKYYGLTESFWLGGSDAAVEGDWSWIVDGTRIDKGTPYWALSYGILGYSHEPDGGSDENCLLMDSKRYYFFADANCAQTNHVLCQQV